jgi:hypothetical protein
MKFVNEGHLGGFVAADEEYPNGDPLTYTPRVWEYLMQRYRPSRIMDVGCGQGHAVKWFIGRCKELYGEVPMWFPPAFYVHGVEGSITGIDSAVVHRLYLLHCDFTQDSVVPNGALDLVWSCEFVEHVAKEYMNNFLQLFGRANVVAMTHAFPGQPGHHHVNCQETAYWVEKMQALGFHLNREATAESRDLAEPSHWQRSGLIFEKADRFP